MPCYEIRYYTIIMDTYNKRNNSNGFVTLYYKLLESELPAVRHNNSTSIPCTLNK